MGESQSRRVSWTLACVLLSLALCFCACRPPRSTTPSTGHAHPSQNAGLPRISPAFTQWLARQSMLGNAAEFIEEVSGSTRLWQQSGSAERFSLLLQKAPTWLAVTPLLAINPHPVFTTYADPQYLKTLADLGITGLFIAPTGETGEIWTNRMVSPSGDDVVSFSFTKRAGSEKDFARLQDHAEEVGTELGGALPPAATGFGPDFMLQLRAVRDYEGLYAAVEVPKQLWASLPVCASEWETKALSPAALSRLAHDGLLPPVLRKDAFSFANQHGWACTGTVLGIDGNERRYVYAYEEDVKRPVLSWQDPSGTAKRLFAAATIRHTGLQRQTLAGLSFKALMGLDAEGSGAHPVDLAAALEPGLGALLETGQTVHRYGGWSISLDALPNEVIPLLLPHIDFVACASFDTALIAALEKSDSSPLETAIKHLVHLPCNRLAFGLHAYESKQTPPPPLTLALTLTMPGLAFMPERAIGEGKQGLNSQESAIQSLLQARRELRAAEGTLLSLPKAPKGCILLPNRLPDGTILLLAVNYSEKSQTIPLDPDHFGKTALRAIDPGTRMTKSGGRSILTLAPKSFQALRLQ